MSERLATLVAALLVLTSQSVSGQCCSKHGNESWHYAGSTSSPTLRGFDAPSVWSVTAHTTPSPLPPGTRITLTYGFTGDGASVFPQIGPPQASSLQTTLDSVFGSVDWRLLIHQAFAKWQDVSGITFLYETADDQASWPSSPGLLGVRADIRLSGISLDGSGGFFAAARQPDLGDIVLDLDDASVFTNPSGNHRVFRNIIAHEIGHALGLEHVCPRDGTKLMEENPTLLTVDGPQDDDIRGAHSSYGDRFEISGNPAIDLGFEPDSANATLLSDLSLHHVGDDDVFRFVLRDCRTAVLAVDPVGGNYQLGQEFGNPACIGLGVRTSQVQNLSMILTGPDGVPIAIDSGTYGQGESFNGILRPGVYTLRVLGSPLNQASSGPGTQDGDVGEVQRYTLTIDLQPQIGERPPSLLFTQEAGPTSLEVSIGCGVPAGEFFVALTLDPPGCGSLNCFLPGSGWWFGLHIGLGDLTTQFASNPYLVNRGTLDPEGNARFDFPLIPAGLNGWTIHGVVVDWTSTAQSPDPVLSASPLATIILQ